jgi:phosphopantothenoylcysteine decarboxylase/phosphopantothenate--cysteine ligase
MSDTHTPTVVIGVTGCIAAYKACELVRELQRGGCRVKVVMTENATRFVGPATFRALTGEPVSVSLWDEPASRVHHTSLAEEADVFVVAPATANVIAKLAQGRADDLLTTVALATEAPIVVAPAMNVHMWRREVTQANVGVLRARGANVIEPETGELACGDIGEGRLAPVAEIAEAVLADARRCADLDGVRVLVYAGATQEPIDPVRFISNRASGKTGHAIAEEAARRGADVTLVMGPGSLPDPYGVHVVNVMTALQMRDAVEAHFDAADVVVASAAVSDFRPAEPSADKLKKRDAAMSVPLERNPDILAGLGERKGERVLVGFAAETRDVLVEARAKLSAKNLDLVVANNVAEAGLGFGSDVNRVWLVTNEGEQEMPVLSKKTIARLLWDRVADIACSAAESRRSEGD